MQKRFLLFIILLATTFIEAQTLRRPITTNYAGLGAYSLNHMDVFSFTANQASLAQLKNSAAGIYAERKFLLNELADYTAVAGIITNSGNFGIKANYAGSVDYNETQAGLAYGRKLSNKVDIGAQFNYTAIRISGGYGSASAISFELGTVLHITDKLNAGFHINNPVGGKFGKDQSEKLSSVYRFGIGYDASTKFFISTEIEKEEDQPVNVNAGFQYKFIPQLLVRAGMSSATSTAWLGVGLTLKSFRLDITSGYHPQLGISPGVLMLFNLKPPSPKRK
jgi:long-subunit fatty acid transport protein